MMGNSMVAVVKCDFSLGRKWDECLRVVALAHPLTVPSERQLLLLSYEKCDSSVPCARTSLLEQCSFVMCSLNAASRR